MKFKKQTLPFVVFVTLLAILLNQVFWIVNMYRSYQQELILALNDGMELSLRKEVTDRINSLDGPMIFRFSPLDSINRDTSEIIERKIQKEDTTIYVKVKKNDPNVNFQILQYLLINDNPIKINQLNGYLLTELKNKGFDVYDSYIEYYDLNGDSLIDHNKPDKWLQFSIVSTDTIPLDILKSVGVKAFVSTSPKPILAKMSFQILLSLLLIIIASYCMIYLMRTIFRQRKIEKMRQDFVNAMVHEFKRPITNASTMLELIPHYLLNNNTKMVDDYLTGSLLEFKKLTAYTDRIQRISNNERERIQLDKVEVALTPFFERLVTFYSANKSKPVEIEILLDTNRVTMKVDELHFTNVIDNLIENAIKYSGEVVHIRIVVKENSEALEILVMDDGYGISNRDKKMIFDKFYRVVSTSYKKTVGFGLGLTYVKAIVEAHGGTIRVMDAPIKGSIFVINLPD